MSTSLMKDAFDHHAWATLRLLETCLELDPAQLDTTVPGTYGSILDTMRHLVESDAWYLFATNGGLTPLIDDKQMDLAQLRATMEANNAGWATLLEADLDPETVVVGRRGDGSETHVPVGIRLAQVLHHGTDHRSQVCTALTALGIEPPGLDLWTFSEGGGRVIEVPPPG